MKGKKKVRWNFSMEWEGPKSVCTCGHLGDGERSDHHNVLSVPGGEGHGYCLREGCKCKQFTWAGFTLPFQKALERERRNK